MLFRSYSKSDYAIQWFMTVSDATLKVNNKTISGRRQASKVECRNMRFQNVFGGTGALSLPPNDRVASFCNSTSSVDFDRIRDQAMKEVAVEVLKVLFPG